MTHSAPIRIIDLGQTHYRETQSLYHAIASRMNESSADTIIFCMPKQPYLCLGYHQSLRRSLDLSACDANRLPVLRRRVGGGTTYLDGNQLFYQCVFHHTRVPAVPQKAYARLLAAPVSVLQEIGMDAELRYVNEIEVGRRRIAGIGGGRIGEASVVVGNFLKDFNYKMMQDVIFAPSDDFRKFAYDAIRSRITTLERERRADCWPELPSLLAKAYGQTLDRDIYRSAPTEQELLESAKQGEKLGSSKFLSRKANDVATGKLPKFKVSGSTAVHQFRAVEGETVRQGIALVHDEIIADVLIESASRRSSAIPEASRNSIPDISMFGIGMPFVGDG